jgi:hypothetical protein
MVDAADTASAARPRIALGLQQNWRQFTLLVLINAFVGGMVGLERTLVPLIGSETFSSPRPSPSLPSSSVSASSRR